MGKVWSGSLACGYLYFFFEIGKVCFFKITLIVLFFENMRGFAFSVGRREKVGEFVGEKYVFSFYLETAFFVSCACALYMCV